MGPPGPSLRLVAGQPAPISAACARLFCARARAPRPAPRARSAVQRVGKEGCARTRGARAGLVPGPGPAHRPCPPGCRGGKEAAELRVGTRRAVRSAEPEPDAAAATATCAAVIKVGRPRAASRAFPRYAMCARCASRLQRPGRDAGLGEPRGTRRGAGDETSSTSA